MTARIESKAEVASSTNAISGLPIPAVVTLEAPRAATVSDCTAPAMPPPAMIAVDHCSQGLISETHAAVAIVPAITAAGDAAASSRLSIQGMQ